MSENAATSGRGLTKSGFWIIFETEFRRHLRSRKLKVLFVVTFFPTLIYLISPNATGTGVDAMQKAFQALMLDLVPNYWLGIIGQLLAIILMSDLLASEIDRGTIRLLLARPVRLSEVVTAKFLAGMSSLAVLFGVPYLIIWLYNPVVYGTGIEGLWKGLSDFALILGATLLVLAALGALAMLVSVIVTRPLYASIATFGLVFLLQFLLPQIPYVKNSERYTLGYQTVVLLKSGFDKLNLTDFHGNPAHTALFFGAATVLLLLLAWAVLLRREFPE
ncbi:ABC transporter permease [Thermococcus sp. LS1]|uniref:ABC transporter permease n=1 Tax=Thermococcus sp. LS1 TaxID=1638259 RepID=UPI0014391199|nr:ABC transporter permease subunit [Thermococcus sp. LS1]NJD99734.1 ABC transporter permease [Thermococcus sp. LS1]